MVKISVHWRFDTVFTRGEHSVQGQIPAASIPPARACVLSGLGSAFERQAALHVTHKQTPNQTMQPQIMEGVSGLFFLFVYLGCVVAVIIYVLRLLGRFVSAHERVAGSLDIIARKMKDDAKP